MAQINYGSKTINCKIVYYGPGMSGKTTNLQVIFDKTPDTNKGQMLSLSTDGDRTLYFDFLPLDLGEIKGFKTKFQLYTVPGQVYYNATRKLVLKGVDAVVFVADSDPAKRDENIESLQNLQDNLKEMGLEVVKDIPLVIQYNKRDLPNVMSVEEMRKDLNLWGVPDFEAIAIKGEGVFKTLKVISKLTIEYLHQKYGVEVINPPKDTKLEEEKVEETTIANGSKNNTQDEASMEEISIKNEDNSIYIDESIELETINLDNTSDSTERISTSSEDIELETHSYNTQQDEFSLGSEEEEIGLDLESTSLSTSNNSLEEISLETENDLELESVSLSETKVFDKVDNIELDSSMENISADIRDELSNSNKEILQNNISNIKQNLKEEAQITQEKKKDDISTQSAQQDLLKSKYKTSSGNIVITKKKKKKGFFSKLFGFLSGK